jgi:soluble lytic murein transglycosylase-like protein
MSWRDKAVKKIILFLLIVIQPFPAGAEPVSPAMFQQAAQSFDVPADLIRAIARVESGLSPWTINVEGKGYVFDSKEKAMEKAQEADKSGKSYDSGVMQVNNFWLKKYGIPLEAALDPAANIHLGSWILKQELLRHGETWSAVGAYHSPNTDKSQIYIEKIKNSLAAGPVTTPKKSKTIPKIQYEQAPLVVARRDGDKLIRLATPVNAVSFVQRISN